ncbi:MAG: hypothetical protein WD830_07765, partial [Chloroflexota bacterium]
KAMALQLLLDGGSGSEQRCGHDADAARHIVTELVLQPSEVPHVVVSDGVGELHFDREHAVIAANMAPDRRLFSPQLTQHRSERIDGVPHRHTSSTGGPRNHTLVIPLSRG